MQKLKNLMNRRWTALLITAILLISMTPTALADTGDSTPKIIQQPDQLILQLGTRWAGVEFELRTDAGIFPVPVVVDETGVLRMDLGGSTTYTLSCIESSMPIPAPEPEPEQDIAHDQPSSDVSPQPQQTEPAPISPQQNQPVWPLIVFLMALAAAGSGFIVAQVFKRRQQLGYDEWDDGNEDE